MRRLCLISVALAMLSASAPIRAQQLPSPAAPPPAVFRVVAGINAGPGPDAVVARVMTFDRNHDGIIVRSELPERMQALLTRADALPKDEGLDAAEIRRLAATSPSASQVNGLQAGHYGFGDGLGFDTRLHIDGALDDLRLAGDVREKAGTIAHDIQATSADRVRAHVLATMESILTPEQFADFKANFEGDFVTVHAVKQGDTLIFGATPQEAARLERNDVVLRVNGRRDLSGLLAKYDLTDAARQRAVEAIGQFELQRTGRLSSVDSQAIADGLTGLLDDEQRADLRAALDRRPIVKQQTGNARVVFEKFVAPAQPGQTFVITDLVLKTQR